MLTLLRGADLYDPEPRGVVDILVGERVLAIGPSLAGSEHFTEIDLGGARVIPGLVDSHVHVTGGGGESGPASRVPPLEIAALLSAGITTCIGLLGTDGTTRNVAGLVARTLGLRVEGMSAWCWTGSYEVPPITITGSVRSDIAFIDPILGVGELAISDHRSSQPTFDELVRIAADCHVGGLMTGKAGVLHLHLGNGKRGLELLRRALDETELPARVFHPTHVNRRKALFEEALAIAKRGCVIDVTAFPVDDDGDEWSAEDAIGRYLDAGLPPERLTCSSDGGGCLPTFDTEGRMTKMDVGRPGAITDALKVLLERGHSLAKVLPVFTRNVGRHLRLPGKKGEICVGGDADLIVLDDEHRPRRVMARGRFVFDRRVEARS